MQHEHAGSTPYEDNTHCVVVMKLMTAMMLIPSHGGNNADDRSDDNNGNDGGDGGHGDDSDDAVAAKSFVLMLHAVRMALQKLTFCHGGRQT